MIENTGKIASKYVVKELLWEVVSTQQFRKSTRMNVITVISDYSFLLVLKLDARTNCSDTVLAKKRLQLEINSNL